MTARGGLGRGLGSLIPPAPSLYPRRADDGEQAAAKAPTSDPPRQSVNPQSMNGQRVNRAAYNVSQYAEGLAADEDESRPAPPPQGRPTASSAYFAEVPIDAIRPNPQQPRTAFDDDALAELADSVALVGLLQPVVVRPAPAGTFELVMGERRWRAAQRAGLEQVPAIVRETRDADLLRDALLENLHRAQLNPLEEAAAYQQLLDDFGVTHEELAERIGRSRPHITNTLRLLRLTPPVQRRVAAGLLSAGHARALVAVSDPERQGRLATQVVAQGLSVRALEELVATADEAPRRQSRARRVPSTVPELDDIAARLAERFDTRCRVELGKRKGKITIEFATVDDLHRIVAALAPE